MVIDRRRALTRGHAAASQCTVVLNGSVWSDSRYVLFSLELRLNSLSVNVQEFGYMQCYFRLIMEDYASSRSPATRDRK